MKVTKRVLHVPPYVSTSWRNVAALRVEDRKELMRPVLVVQLIDGTSIDVPDLNETLITRIFDAHATFLEDEEHEEELEKQSYDNQAFGLPFQIGPGGMEGIGNALQHDPAQAAAPDLPAEILDKVAAVAGVLGADHSSQLPVPVENCNCFHCQIAKAINKATGNVEDALDEEVSDDDLKFREWDIEDRGDNLYTVKNPLDLSEEYQVFLGDPIGCTCGHKDCEHIKSVLNS